MAKAIYTNNAAGTLAADIGVSDTLVLLGAGQGATFPSPTGGDYFYVTLVHNVTFDIEIAKCTARAADTLTIVRGQDSTTAIAFTTGSVVEARIVAAGLREMDYRSVYGVANGVATLDADAKVPDTQIPAGILRTAAAAATYIPLTQRGAANGVATLDAGSKIPVAQIPDLAATYIPIAQRAAANGVATLDATTKIPTAQIPSLNYLDKTAGGTVAGGTTFNATLNTAAITAGGDVSSSKFKSPGTTFILGNSGAGSILLRPNGSGSTANQVSIASTGIISCVDVASTSDRRLKQNVQKHATDPYLVDKLRLAEWTFRIDGRPGTGVIAQEVQKVAPQYVTKNPTNRYLGVDKAGLAIEAVIGLAMRVRKLEKESANA